MKTHPSRKTALSALSALSALIVLALPAASRAEPCDIDLLTLGAPTLRCRLHQPDPLVTSLSDSAVPGRLNFQARLSQAKLLLGDRALPLVQVKLQDLKGQTLCAMERSGVVVEDSVLNLELREEALGGCKLGEALARHGQLRVQVCFGAQSCLRPLKLSAAPYALKAEYSYWALKAERAEQASVSHYTSRLTADRDLLNTARRSLDQNLTGEFVVDSSAPTRAAHPETGATYEVDARPTDGALLWSPATSAPSTLYIASKDTQRDALRRLNRLSFVAQRGIFAGHLSIDGLPQGDRRDGLQLVQGDLYLKNPLSVSQGLSVRGAQLNLAHPLPLSAQRRQVEGDLSPAALEGQYALSLSDHNAPSSPSSSSTSSTSSTSRALRLSVVGDTSLTGALWLGQSLTASGGMSVVGATSIEGRLSAGPLSVQGEGRGAGPSLQLATGPSASTSLLMSSLTVGPSPDATPSPLVLARGDLKVSGAVRVTGDSRFGASLSMSPSAAFATARLTIQTRESSGAGDLAPSLQSELLASEGNTLYLSDTDTKLIIRGQTRVMGEVEFRVPPTLSGGCRIQIPPDQRGLAIRQVERFSLVCGERSVTLRPFRCGDRVVDPGEQCDQGDVRDGDGCSSHCLCEPENLIDGVYYPPTDITKPLIPCSGDSCGNGVIDLGEACDDPRDASCINCQRAICGDGVLSPGEACDDGNNSNNDGCSSTCAFERRRFDLAEDSRIRFTLFDGITDPQGRDLVYDCSSMTKGTLSGVTVAPPGMKTGTLSAPAYTHTIEYVPQPDVNGTDSFVCTVNPSGVAAGGAEERALSARVVIAPVNDAPVASDDALTINEDTAGSVDVLANDSDVDQDLLSLTSCGNGAKGTTTEVGGAVTYTPTLNASGPDSFTCTISDGSGASDTSTVSVTITPVNDAPTAVNDALTTSEDTAGSVSVLANDSDAEGDALTLVSCGDGAKGTTTEAAGVVTYTPTLNLNGADSFTCTIRDAGGATATSTVSVTITPVNDAPTAVNDTLTTNEDTAGSVSALANDSDAEGDALTLVSCVNGTKGTTTEAAGVVTYTPTLNLNGADSFTCTIRDAGGATSTSTVSVTITPVNDAPTAVNDALTTSEDTAGSISVLANDSDAEGDALTLVSCGNGTKGTTTEAAGVVTYTPTLNLNGADSFTCTVSDGNGGTSTSTVSVTITPVNDAPTAVNDALTTSEDTNQTLILLSNDSDVDGDSLSLVSCTDGAKGTTAKVANTARYTPTANANGADSFECTISDGNGGTSTSTVSVTITPVNDPPSAVADALSATTATPSTLNVLANDTDPDLDPALNDPVTELLSLVSCTTPSNGTRAVNTATGEVTYTSDAAFTGADSFDCTIRDSQNAQRTATVTVTVTPVTP